MAIQSFGDKDTEALFLYGRVKKGVPWAALKRVAVRKLDMIHYAALLDDLRSPPGNRLEELKGNLKGFHSIRINDQWRVVFKWTEFGAKEVQIIDYH
jgi:proteic killer suppression protein